MKQDVFGLRYEFVYRHGHHMELFKEGGIAGSELSTLQVRMLEANQVPRLLPLDIHEVDANLRLQYRLSSKRMLTHVLKVGAFSSHHLSKLMYAIVCTLDESKNYMLYEMNFVLKDNFIFVGQDWSDVYLTYVPLDMQHDEDDVCLSIDSLLRKLITHVGEEEQDQLQAWISTHLVKKSLLGYKEAFLKLMDEPVQMRNPTTPTTPTTSTTSTVTQTEPVEAALPELELPKAHWKRKEDTPIQLIIPNLAKLDHKPLSFIPLNQRARWMTTALILILSAFLWQQYLTYPSTSTLQLIAGITLLLGDVVFVLLCKGRPVFPHATIPNPDSANSSDASTIAAAPMDMTDYYQNLPMHTTLLSPSKSNATVFLGKSPKQMPLGPRLEFQIEGSKHSVPVSSEVFTIGRGDSSSKVDYVMEIAGVSRIHAEIVQTNNGYQLRDAGSTNGTYLNDHPLVTYQAYPLKDGDIVRIIRQEMTFRLL